MIEVNNLSKKFGTKEVLKNISLKFEAGKTTGIVGENGAGKTTLFRCIAGLEEFNGSIISERMPLKNHLGLLVTDPYFFSKITGREYLQLLCNARNSKSDDLNGRNIFDLPLDQYASTYSSGMKKKLAITALLLQENDYFILDEPFNGVDLEGNMIITEVIHQLRKLGKTIILSSHIFSTLSETCDVIHLMKNGVITESAPKENFQAMEHKMKNILIGNKIERLNLKS